MALLNVKKEDNVALITMNNPPVNAFSQPMKEEMVVLLDELEKDEEVRVLVFTGNERAFMAGADITRFPRLLEAKRAGLAKESAKFSFDLLKRIASFPKPTIAAVNNIALGAGAELSLLCDIRLAGESAKFGLPEINLGLIPGGGGTQRLPRIIGPAKAKEMMFLGDQIDAQEAKEFGLVSKVFADEDLVEEAMKLAKRIARRSGSSTKIIKEAVNRGLEMSLDAGLELEQDLFDRSFLTEDGQEGVVAFLEKRKPAFKHC
jgi:enoyl-CoA hydratase